MRSLSTRGAEAERCFKHLPQVEYYREELTHDTLKLMPNVSDTSHQVLSLLTGF